MKVKLHTCPFPFLRVAGHSCWRVESALRDAGIEYEIVKQPVARGKRARIEELTGQRLVPVVESEGGVAYRAESVEMAAVIRAGGLARKLGQEADAGA